MTPPLAVWITGEAIGPVITLVVWIAILSYRVLHARGDHVSEWLAVVGSLVVLQLLLDLHTRYLGDLVIVALHAVAVAAAMLLRKRRTRSTTRPSASDEAEGG